jgi:serine/threonine-protein kinase
MDSRAVMKRRGCQALLVSIAALAGTVSRSAAATDPAAATMLFNEARHLAASGRYPEACPKFEESQRLDPGIGTQFNLADCYEHTSRLASAWALFLDVASAAGGTGQAARESVARKRAAALEPRLSKLTIEAPRNAAGLEVRRNGEVLGASVWNSPIPVDPGSYTIEASAPGRKKWSTLVTVGRNGATVTVAIPILEERSPPSSPAPPADGATAGTDTSAPPSASPSSGESMSVERTVALALGGAGVVGIGIGSFFGLRSIAKHSDYETLCAGNPCPAAAGPLHDQAVAAGNASTVAFVLGGALIAGGAVLWLVAPQPASSSVALRVVPAVGSSAAGAMVAGAW